MIKDEILTCKRLILKQDKYNREKILLGVIEKETDTKIILRTKKGLYAIPKENIIDMEDTNQVFIEGKNGN